MSDRTYDYAILGAGVSGLLLALRLQQEQPDCSLLLVDGAEDDDVLRTLSFWANAPTAIDFLVRHRYRSMVLRSFEAPDVPIELREYEYRTLFFADLQREVKSRLHSAAQHTILEGRATTSVEQETLVEVTVDNQTYRARYVFDSRFRLSELAVDTPSYHDERQHFRGWIVRSKTPRFANLAPHFMDFRTRLAPGRSFFYVLPFADNVALVELVTLDKVDATAELERYLEEQLQLPSLSYEVVDREAGVSPMTEQPLARQRGARTRALGLLAGRAKASSGYALARILEDTEAIVQSLATHQHPFAAPPQRAIFRWLDGVFLEVWATRPAQLPQVFRRLFARNRADAVCAFLDERASFFAIVRIALTLPLLLFVWAVAHWSWRRLRGA